MWCVCLVHSCWESWTRYTLLLGCLGPTRWALGAIVLPYSYVEAPAPLYTHMQVSSLAKELSSTGPGSSSTDSELQEVTLESIKNVFMVATADRVRLLPSHTAIRAIEPLACIRAMRARANLR